MTSGPTCLIFLDILKRTVPGRRKIGVIGIEVMYMLRGLFTATLLLFIFALAAFAQTGGPMFVQDISWSPDGRYIAFSGIHDVDRKANTLKSDIYVVGSDGSDLRMIGSNGNKRFFTSWAKDRIAFSQDVPGTKDSNLYTVKQDGSDLRQITNGPGRNAMPSISKDGRHIVFASASEGGKYQIYIMNADGTGVKRLTTDDKIAYFNPQISPNGKSIVFYAEKGDQRDQIWTIRTDGSNATLLTGNIGHNVFPGWSPDGRRIIFSSSKREQKPDGTFVDGTYVYVMNADGSGIAKLGGIKSFFARFSPNGKKIAYIVGGFPSTSIYIANPDGSGALKVTQ